jgi:hypothetical protein
MPLSVIHTTQHQTTERNGSEQFTAQNVEELRPISMYLFRRFSGQTKAEHPHSPPKKSYDSRHPGLGLNSRTSEHEAAQLQVVTKTA